MIIDISVPGDAGIADKGQEKIMQYQDVALMRHQNVHNSGCGWITENLAKHLKDRIQTEIELLQKAAILESGRILRQAPEILGCRLQLDPSVKYTSILLSCEYSENNNEKRKERRKRKKRKKVPKGLIIQLNLRRMAHDFELLQRACSLGSARFLRRVMERNGTRDGLKAI